jgi:Uma2 family endonuclease
LREHRTRIVRVKTKPSGNGAEKTAGLTVSALVACYPRLIVSTFDRLSDLAPERVRPLKRIEFERLVSEGLFDDERIELLGGVIVEMSPQDTRHSAIIERLSRVLMAAVGADASVRTQLPFAASEFSLPEPDLAVVPRVDYDEAHPDRAYLVVEVANSSLRKDRSIKSELYARAGVPEYWVVNIGEREVEVRTLPRDGAYTTVTIARPGDTLHLAALGGAALAVNDFLR